MNFERLIEPIPEPFDEDLAWQRIEEITLWIARLTSARTRLAQQIKGDRERSYFDEQLGNTGSVA